MTKEPYSYCFLQYCHEPLSGEFANIGVLVWAPRSQYLGFEATERFSRLSEFFGGFESGDYRNIVARLKTRFRQLAGEFEHPQSVLPTEARPESAREIALRVVPHDSAALQWSRSGGGLASDPHAELQDLFQQYIGRHYEKERAKGRNERIVYREVYQKVFQEPVVARHLSSHHVHSEFADHTFPNAWKNGIWNVYETLSFDLVSGDQIRAKAHRWESMTRYLHEAEKLKITYLLGAPEGRNRKAYGTAKLLLEKAQARLVEENEAEDFGRELASRIAAAAH
ncbi:DUF3037 domain-containing protein [Luteolibacter marinus]|uniref:DUF3037 domain-containing protein n=1 Tax=Luteolibacter marinus TaxID=2776705 RepID=UPI001869602B|nr:DUF3037 domain-containing protein [Luteolibacter marinus]